MLKFIVVKDLETEEPRIAHKYGRYCINSTMSSVIIDKNIKFFSLYQFNHGLNLRVDAMLIKPIQRLTRYHMFLSSLSKTCSELGLHEDSEQFSGALSSILSAAIHTNTMMWIGKMEDCPLDLPGQGQLLKQGKVGKRFLGSVLKRGKRTSSQKSSASQLFLFQKSLILCTTKENLSESNNPHLWYEQHISLNQVRVRDVIADDENTFEVHKLENMEDHSSNVTVGGIMMRLECESEDNKNHWVIAIKSELKHLRSMSKHYF